MINTTSCGASLALLTETGKVGVRAMASDDNGVFWTNMIDTESGDVLGWVSGSLTPVTQGDVQPIDVQIDANFVYYVSFNALNGVQGSPTLHTWSRSTGDGVDVPLSAVTAGMLAVDPSRAYFGAWQTDTNAGLYSVALPLGDASAPLQLAGNLDSPFHVAVDSTALYFDQAAGTDEKGTSLWSMPLDGGGPSLVRDQTNVAGLTLVNGTAYWATAGANTIENSNGSKITIANPVDVVVDTTKTYLYVITENEGSDDVFRIRIADKNITKCATAFSIAAISVATGHVYFAAFANGTYGIYDLTTN